MNQTNYNREMEERMQAFEPGTPLLLHVCCAPCATSAIQRLAGHFSLTLFYYNPNIWPFAEYQKRLDAFAPLLEQEWGGYPIRFLEGEYEEDAFSRVAAPLAAQPEGGSRCAACFSLRLSETARQAALLGFPLFATTLTVGPRKNAALICGIGAAEGQRHGVEFLPADFKKKDGYRRSVAMSRELGLYRQHYCGCRYSLPPASAEASGEEM